MVFRVQNWKWILAAALAGAVMSSSPGAAGPRDNLIGRGSHLIDLNLGYGRWLTDGAPKGSFGFGIGFLYFPSEAGAVGVDVTSDRLGEVPSSIPGETINLELTSILVQGLIHPPTGALVPYVGAGAGPYFFRSSVEGESESGTHWGVMGRAGVRMVAWRPMLGLDLRHHWVFIDPKEHMDFAAGRKLTRFLSLKATISLLF
jgi:hypothetical protein